MQHGTNKHGLKMMLWVTVDGTGSTKILACSLMLDESAESCAWSCQCFSDCFRVAPAVILSDSAPQLKAAIASVFPPPTTLHLKRRVDEGGVLVVSAVVESTFFIQTQQLSSLQSQAQ
jgi:hypothetical protein